MLHELVTLGARSEVKTWALLLAGGALDVSAGFLCRLDYDTVKFATSGRVLTITSSGVLLSSWHEYLAQFPLPGDYLQSYMPNPLRAAALGAGVYAFAGRYQFVLSAANLSTGSYSWARRYQPLHGGVPQDPDGSTQNYVTTDGTSAYLMGTVGGANGLVKVHILKVSAAGAVQWGSSLDGYDVGQGVGVGLAYVGGALYGLCGYATTGYRLSKFNASTGALEWQRSLAVSATGMTAWSFNELLTDGVNLYAFGETSINYKNYRMVVKISATGTILWAYATYGDGEGGTFYYSARCCVSPNGDVYFAFNYGSSRLCVWRISADGSSIGGFGVTSNNTAVAYFTGSTEIAVDAPTASDIYVRASMDNNYKMLIVKPSAGLTERGAFGNWTFSSINAGAQAVTATCTLVGSNTAATNTGNPYSASTQVSTPAAGFSYSLTDI